MSEYEVIVYTTVREVYYVQAESEEDARHLWPDVDLDHSECDAINEVKVIKVPDVNDS